MIIVMITLSPTLFSLSSLPSNNTSYHLLIIIIVTITLLLSELTVYYLLFASSNNQPLIKSVIIHYHQTKIPSTHNAVITIISNHYRIIY
jgi:hypothetical protein